MDTKCFGRRQNKLKIFNRLILNHDEKIDTNVIFQWLLINCDLLTNLF